MVFIWRWAFLQVVSPIRRLLQRSQTGRPVCRTPRPNVVWMLPCVVQIVVSWLLNGNSSLPLCLRSKSRKWRRYSEISGNASTSILLIRKIVLSQRMLSRSGGTACVPRTNRVMNSVLLSPRSWHYCSRFKPYILLGAIP
jgi:hypothetical protein